MPNDAREFDLKTKHTETHAFIQWKGTDACIDFRCHCGRHYHIDAEFLYFIKCPACGALWEMPSMLFPRLLSKDSPHAAHAHVPPIEDSDVLD